MKCASIFFLNLPEHQSPPSSGNFFSCIYSHSQSHIIFHRLFIFILLILEGFLSCRVWIKALSATHSVYALIILHFLRYILWAIMIHSRQLCFWWYNSHYFPADVCIINMFIQLSKYLNNGWNYFDKKKLGETRAFRSTKKL